MEKIPTIGCFVYDGNASEMKMKNKYLGNIYEKAIDDSIKVNLQLNTNAEMDQFTFWWLQHLNYGVNEFEIEIMYFGLVRKLMVKMTNNLKTTLTDSGSWTVPMELEVQYLVDH